MRKPTLICALLLASFVLTSSALGASWKSNGWVTYVEVAQPSSPGKVMIQVGSTWMLCLNASINGTLTPSPTFTTNPWPDTALLTPSFSSCTVAGIGFTVGCASRTWSTSTAPWAYTGPATSPAANGASVGTATLECTLKIGPTSCSTLSGTVTFIHSNAGASVPAVETIDASTQSLTMSDIGSGCAAIPSGTATLTSGTGSDISYDVTSPTTLASQPRIWWGV